MPKKPDFIKESAHYPSIGSVLKGEVGDQFQVAMHLANRREVYELFLAGEKYSPSQLIKHCMVEKTCKLFSPYHQAVQGCSKDNTVAMTDTVF